MQAETHGETWEDDEILFQVVDEEKQLWVRVGQVFYGNEPHSQKGVWVTLMVVDPENKNLTVHEDFLLSKNTWKKLNKHVKKRFKPLWLTNPYRWIWRKFNVV